ncbi:MAG: hypothetical protein JXJ20_05280 [Anaerolineae bacterium]|nr:hypothetical protein [Anaerolineae bacterium]
MKQIGKPKAGYWVDVALFTLLMLVIHPHATGIETHQYIGMALLGGIVIHLVLHRHWITAVISRRSDRVPRRTRLLFWLDTFLAAAFALTLVTGLAIAPAFGNDNPPEHLVGVHHGGAVLVVLGMLLHLVTHRKWLVTMTRRCVFGRCGRKTGLVQSRPAGSHADRRTP